MKNVAILLNGPIKNDARVIKIIRYISTFNYVFLFYVDGLQEDKLLFNDNVKLYTTRNKDTLSTKLIRHSYFYLEYLFLSDVAIKSQITFDYIWANDLPCLKPAVKLKKQTGAILIYDSHEIYIETLNQFFPSKTGLFKSLVFRFLLTFMRFVGKNEEKKLLKKTDYFVTVGNELRKFFEGKYNYPGIRILMNCPSKSKMPEPFDLKLLLGINQTSKLFIYQGVLNYGRGLHLMIEAFKYVNNNIFLLILGSGMLKQELLDLVKLNNLEHKVFFLDKVDLKVLPDYTSSADFGMNLLEDINLSKKFAVPNKLFEYIHAGLPVVSSNMPESASVYNEFNIGKLVENDTKKIAKAVNDIAIENINDYHKNCELAANKYNWENQLRVIDELLSLTTSKEI